MSKTNPRKIPRSQADVERAREQGRDEGINGALTIMLFTLMDKFGADDAQLREFADAFSYTVDSIERGYITEADLRKVVRDEYHTTIETKKDPARMGVRNRADTR
jgi:hypothetical protein